MAGTLRQFGTVVTGAAGTPVSRNLFSWLVGFFDAHPGYTRIASYYGDAEYIFPPPTFLPVKSAGLGFGKIGTLTAVGDAAWAVYRKTVGYDTFDLFLGFSISTNTVTHPSGSYWAGYGVAGGVGVMWAWNVSSASWLGTTVNNGLDSFTTPWKSDSILLPCSNEKSVPQGGAFTVNTSGSRNGAATLMVSAISENCFLNCVADDDSFNIFWDSANQVYESGIILERYVPYTSSFDLPYFMFGRGAVFNQFKVQNEYNSPYLGIAHGITAKKNLPGRTNLISSYAPRLEYSRFLGRSVPNAVSNQNFGRYFTSASAGQPQAISEFPVHLGIASPIQKYAGHLEFFRIIPWDVASDTKFGGQTRYSLGFELGAGSFWGSGSIPWSSSFTGHPSSSVDSTPNLFHTSTSFGSIALMPVTTSNLFEDITIGISNDVILRGKGGSTSYTASVNTPPPATTDIVALFSNYA